MGMVHAEWCWVTNYKAKKSMVTTDYRNVLIEMIVAQKLSVENAFPNLSGYKQISLCLFSKS